MPNIRGLKNSTVEREEKLRKSDSPKVTVQVAPENKLLNPFEMGKGKNKVTELTKIANAVSDLRGRVEKMNVVRRTQPVKEPSLMSSHAAPASLGMRVKTTNKPRFQRSQGGVVVVHKEMIGSLTSSSTTLTFASTGFVVNPGKPAGFPWLSTLASNFDKYRMRKLVVHLVSSQATSVAGRMGVGIDYDSTDSLPADRVDFFNLTHHAECAVWDSVTLNIPVLPETKFVNSHTNTDSKLIDMGQIVVMSDQVVATSSVLADIIVEYHVELLEPQQAPLYTGSFTGSNPSTFASLAVSGPNVGALIPTSSTTVAEWSFPQGCYEFAITIYDAGAGTPAVTIDLHGGIGRRNNGSGTTTAVTNFGVFKITTNDGTLRFTFSSVAIANLESVAITFSRISPVTFNALNNSSVLQTGISSY